jgi:hypothetical protein
MGINVEGVISTLATPARSCATAAAVGVSVNPIKRAAFFMQQTSYRGQERNILAGEPEFHLLCAAALALPFHLAAEDWPQWRGPSSQGISSETGLPTQWSATKNLVWKAALAGTGASSPIVSGDLVIVTSQIGSQTTANGNDPRLARDDRSLAARETQSARRPRPMEVHLVVEALLRTSGSAGGNTAFPPTAQPQPREAQSRYSDAGQRRQAHVRLVRQRAGGGARSGGS